MLQSLYLAITAVFFALFFAEDAERRAELCLKAYAAQHAWWRPSAASSAISTSAGLGRRLHDVRPRLRHRSRTPTCSAPTWSWAPLYYMQQPHPRAHPASLRDADRPCRSSWRGIFLSFSRGSWGAFVYRHRCSVGLPSSRPTAAHRAGASCVMTLLAVVHRRLIALVAACCRSTAFANSSCSVLALDAGLRRGRDRAASATSCAPCRCCSTGSTGFGPLRFRLFFDLDPHNSYINAFASYGWLGGSPSCCWSASPSSSASGWR